MTRTPGRIIDAAAVALWLVFAFSASAEELTGRVLSVADGDTLTLVSGQRIRLVDIDAPELDQPRGKDSRAALFHLCASKQAVIETHGEDRFGVSSFSVQ